MGKKRLKENNGQTKSMKSNGNKKNVVLFNLKTVNNSEKTMLEELNDLYNMNRFISFQCFETKNFKYSNNEYIPSIHFG